MPRRKTAQDAYLIRIFAGLMPAYEKAVEARRRTYALPDAQAEKQAYDNQITIFRDFSGLDLLLAFRLKSAYDQLVGPDKILGSDVLLPAADKEGHIYLVRFQQEYSGKGPAMPYLDVIMYNVDQRNPQRVANITLDHVPGRLRKVEVGVKKPIGSAP